MKRRFANDINDGNIYYQQKIINIDGFNGYVSYVKMGEVNNPIIVNENTESEVCIMNTNYEWLEIYPNNENYAITVMYDDNNNLIEWYFDISKEIGIENNIPYEDDLYLDLLIMPNGEYKILDEDELVNAKDNNIISSDDYDLAYSTLDKLKDKYVNNIDSLKSLTDYLLNEFSDYRLSDNNKKAK